MLSPAYLRQRLRYEPETGKLYWRHWAAARPQWNGRYAGTEAFTAVGTHGYRCGRLDGRNLLAHRVIWAMANDAWPEEQIDHEDHDKANNQPSNLRDADNSGNRHNMPQRRDNSSGTTGVYWHHARSKWVAEIRHGGRKRYLGIFTDFADAVAVRKAAEVEHDFHPNHGAQRS